MVELSMSMFATKADYWQARAEAAERALAERAGGLKVRELLDEGLEILNGIIDNVKRRGNYSPESTCVFIDQAGQCLREALSTLTTEPAAPEGRQEAVAWRYRWRDGGDWKLSFHFDDGLDPAKYEQEPLFTRPAEQAVTEAARRVLEWVYPIAGDNRDEAAAKEEIDSVEALKAAMEEGR